ncbi:MAG: hypothetical protein AAB550_00880 [Patescibacteria group bacterium]
MNVVVSKNFNTEKWLYEDFKKPTFSKNLLDRFALTDTVKGTQYSKNTNNIGVTNDVMHPRFCTFSYESLVPIWTEEVVLILATSDLEHEWTHVEQYRSSLPYRSLWAERAAMSQSMKVMFQLLNSMQLKKDSVEILVERMQRRNQTIYNYRNGKGFENHLTTGSMNSHGTPMKRQSLHTEDFKFGY